MRWHFNTSESYPLGILDHLFLFINCITGTYILTHHVCTFFLRDESFVEFALKMMVQVLINFSIGLIMAFFIFVFGLWSIVRSYQPNPITAVIYFVSAVCAAFAFVSSYLLMLYGAAAGTIYGAAKVAESQRRLEGGGGGYRQQRVQYGGGGGGRPHWQ